MATIAVLGAGAWGSALTLALTRGGHTIRLWAHSEEERISLNRTRRHEIFPVDTTFPSSVEITSDVAYAVSNQADILVAVPSYAFADVLTQMQPHLSWQQGIASATKGLDPRGSQLQHRTAKTLCKKHPFVVITGPSFAGEVARNLPTALLVASKDWLFRHRWRDYLRHDTLRIYESTDVIGAEVGGIVKNVLAIAVGISDGLSFGANTRAALITRGLAEMIRFGKALGGMPKTLCGLSGLGDLVLTATDNQSRNRRLGLLLASGATLEQACKEIGAVVEGAQNAQQLHALSQQHRVDMPICHAVYRVLYEQVPPQAAVQILLERASSAE